MYSLVPIIFVIGVMVVAFTIDYARSQSNKQRIADYLYTKGASSIVVARVWFSWDRGNFAYDVIYSDRQGQPRQVRCKVNSSWLSNHEIFWLTPPEV